MALEGIVLGGASLVAAFAWIRKRNSEVQYDEDFERPSKKRKTVRPIDLGHLTSFPRWLVPI
jgi:hypothetical protein